MTTSEGFSQYQIVLTCEPASFWRENVVAVDILLPTSRSENVVVAETSYQLLEVFFHYYFAIGRGLNLLQ